MPPHSLTARGGGVMYSRWEDFVCGFVLAVLILVVSFSIGVSVGFYLR